MGTKGEMTNLVIMFQRLGVLLLFIISQQFAANAQRPELGFMGGGMYYLGDLNQLENFKCTHLTGSFFLRQNLNYRLNMRYQFTYGNVSAADSLNDNLHAQNRNLSFTSRIIEVAGILEINFLPFDPGNKKRHYATPYLMMGFGLFKMNPMARMNDDMFELQPLGTEGQGTPLSDKDKYKLTQPGIPLGIGFKGNLSERLVIGFEYCIRKTFTDYLDDVSGDYADPVELERFNGPLAMAFADRSITPENINNSGMNRGNSNFKDWYATAGIYLTIKLGKEPPCYDWKRKK